MTAGEGAPQDDSRGEGILRMTGRAGRLPAFPTKCGRVTPSVLPRQVDNLYVRMAFVLR